MKEALGLDAQIELLLERGLEIGDMDAAKKLLTDVTYYRLSGYLRPFQIAPGLGGNDRFREGSTIEAAARIYYFDAELRNIVSNALAIFELVFRSRLTNLMAMNLGPTGHLDDGNYRKYEDYVFLASRIDESILLSKEVFIRHHREAYPGEDVPIWKAAETFSFGLVSQMFAALREARFSIIVAAHWEFNGALFKRVVEHLSYVRNLCAHHSRLWNREMVKKLPEFQNSPVRVVNALGGSANTRVFQSLVVINHLVRTIESSSDFESRIVNLLARHTDLAPSMGFPDGHDLKHL